MGKLLNVVAYVSGLRADGSDTQTDYVLKKRAYLHKRADALVEFGNQLIAGDQWSSAKPISFCASELVVETDLDERPMLRALVEKKEEGTELTFVVVGSRDLCRPAGYSYLETVAFEDIIYPYLSVVFAGGFLHADRQSPIFHSKTPRDEVDACTAGDRILANIMQSNKSHQSAENLSRLQGQLLDHVGEANKVLKQFSKRLVRRRGTEV